MINVIERVLNGIIWHLHCIFLKNFYIEIIFHVFLVLIPIGAIDVHNFFLGYGFYQLF